MSIDTIVTFRWLADAIPVTPQQFEWIREVDEQRFHESLWLSILEKLVIAIIVALFGFSLNRALERYKARSAFLAGYTDRHIGAISEAWRLMYTWEAAVKGHLRFYSSVELEDRHDVVDDLLPAIDESRRLSRDVRTYVDENRFWLGEDLYMKFVKYHNNLDPYIDAVVRGQLDDRSRLELRMQEHQEDILTLLHVKPDTLYR